MTSLGMILSVVPAMLSQSSNFIALNAQKRRREITTHWLTWMLCCLGFLWVHGKVGSADEPSMDKTPPVKIQPQEARKFIGQNVEVTFLVKAAKYSEKRKTVYLDSEANFHLETNLGIAIDEQGIFLLKDVEKIESPADHFRGKTIRVTGLLILEDERPYIRVTSSRQISVIPQPAPKL